MTTFPLTGTVLFAHGSRDPLWREPIEALAGEGSQGRGPSPKSLGRALAKHRGRIVGGLRLERRDNRDGIALWRAEPLAGFAGFAGSFQVGVHPFSN